MARVVDYIEQNICVIKQLVQLGRVPLSLMTDYDIYLRFLATDILLPKMKRYGSVGTDLKVSIDTVRKAVREMEKDIKKPAEINFL